ncbi:MAG: group III truncated hemoglobin [Bacteroidota bacterium]
MERTDITSEEDVHVLVRTFYGKVREDELLGPIFNNVIEDWEEHFERLTNFWVSNLFFSKKYHGDPLQKHVEVDAAHNGTINEMHFGVWLNLWFETIDELFKGEVAQIAKNRARNMSTFIHLKMFKARNHTDQK